MEEFIGKIWDKFITDSARRHYPEAAVHLDEVRHTAGIFFRALGGEGGLRVEDSTESNVHARRSLIQRIAGSGKKTRYAWRDDETLRLPDSIALFPDKELNRDLYLWLTALSVIDGEGNNWISRNQDRTKKTLQTWPGLQARYQKLLQAHLRQRPNPEHLPAREADQEIILRKALSDPACEVTLDYARRPPWPVSLWLHPSPPEHEIKKATQPNDPDIQASSDNKGNQQKHSTRKQAENTDMPDGKDGLMSFRLESLWSWAEYTRVDRTSVEDDDDDLIQTANDMDHISIAQDAETTSGKIKLDLDLPAEEYDDIVLADGIPIDEWDFKQQHLLKKHCRLQIMATRNTENSELPARLRPQIHKIRRQFELLQPQRLWLNRQYEGSELDLDSYMTFLADRKNGRVDSHTPVYREVKNIARDLSCLLLADLSLSTDAYINNDTRVIDVIQDSLTLFSEALNATGDHFALHGFSSRNRNHIRFYNIKTFDEKYSKLTQGRISAIKPGYYTRMGAAIRYATSLLKQQNSTQKLLLLLTDGKPNDLDKYEGRYGIEDTRMAVLEAEKAGLRPFCVTIDENAEEYLPYLFGSRSYVVIRQAEELPRKLPALYLRLTN